MDLPGSDLDSSLPHSDNPCLIVEDSQPDSVALEDDPEGGYRAVLARRLSSLQPPARSPVLELVSSPLGSKSSQTDSQSEFSLGNNQEESDILMATDPSTVTPGESQVLNVCPPPVRKCSLEDTDAESGADSTTHCVHPDGGTSQFSLMELSQSQDLCSEATNNHRGDNGFIASLPEEGATKSGLKQQCQPTQSKDNAKASRSEVSSSSSSESSTPSARQLTVQVLLHSEGLQTSQQDDQMLLSQEDLFDGDKTVSTVDSTVSEPEQTVAPTPARSLHLLHLSGQGTLVQQSLSQGSVDYVAPSQEDVPDTPLIVPSSPTAAESQQGRDEPMDTSEEQVVEGEESVDHKPLPSVSTPVSQNSPGFVLDEMLSVPSQPDFSHDVFGSSQSQEATKQAEKKNKSSAQESLSQRGYTMEMSPMQLSVNTQNSRAVGLNSQHCADDSQATQIDEEEAEEEKEEKEKEEPPADEDQKSVPADSQTSLALKSDATKHCGKRPGSEPSVPSRKATSNAEKVNVKGRGSGVARSPLPRSGSADLTGDSCVEETPLSSAPCSLASQSMIWQASTSVAKTGGDRQTVGGTVDAEMDGLEVEESQEEVEESQEEVEESQEKVEKSQEKVEKSQEEVEKSQEEEEKSQEEEKNSQDEEEAKRSQEEKEEKPQEDSTEGGESSGLALVLSQSQLLSPEPMEEGGEDGDVDSVVMLAYSEAESQLPQGDHRRRAKTNNSQAVAANGHESQMDTSDGPSQSRRARLEPEGLKDKSLSDSSGDISFHFTLPKDGELIGPAVGATPPLLSQLKRTLRHSTPIEVSSFSEKSVGVAEVSAASSVTAAEGGEVGEGKCDADGKLSLRMKLVTPVEEVNSERFSLQKPTLSQEGGADVQDAAVAGTSSPSVFSRVREVHRQQQQQEDATAVREELFASSPLQSSQASSLGCCSLPNSQSDALQQEASSEQQPQQRLLQVPKLSDGAVAAGAPEPVTPIKKDSRMRFSIPSSKLQQRSVSQQTSFELPPPPLSPAGRGVGESPPCKRTAGPSHRRHVRTIQEVRTTVTRIITDVYYEDGKEVERKVSQESEEPVVDCQVLDSDISPCRTGNSSVTSGDLADVSSLSSKASSLQHSSGGTSSGASNRPHFAMPPSRGGASLSPRRGGGHHQRGHRGQRAGLAVPTDRGHAHLGSPALTRLSPRGRARRGRPPSRSFLSRGGSSAAQRLGALDQPPSSSEDEPLGRTLPTPRLPSSPSDSELPAHSDSLRSTEDDACSNGSSFVGLRVVAKWSSNGYFYSGRIVGDAGEQRFRLRFDDGYECEVAGKDILLCDPIPLETEVTALLEDDFFSVGVVKGHKPDGKDLSYSVQRDGQCQWFKRTEVILSLEQGNKLREHHSLGPYQPSTPLTKASDISLDNLVEGKRRRRVATETIPSRGSTPNRSPAPGPSGKRKLISTDEDGGGGGSSSTPAKRGRRGPRAATQRSTVCNTSGSGADLPAQPGQVADTHGPLPHNASLFMGFAFMLTVSAGSDRLTNRLSSDEEEEYVQTGPYNRAYTESQLEAGGGFILPDFNEEQCKAAYQSLLIADQHCRTKKYLLCLASGVPCVSHLWVRDCCKENKLLNYRNYLLPAGVAPDQAIIEWHARRSPFKALRVLLALEGQAELLAQLTTLGGASSVQHYRADGDDGAELPAAGRYDVVVTDDTCPPPLQKWAGSQDVPLVSAEWLVQSVIKGERQDFAGEPRYHHDHTS